MESSGLKRIFYQKLRDYVYHIPGENPSLFTLCGTNCFVVGRGNNRVMIEAGDYPERNQLFLENFNRFLTDFSHVSIEKIFITHGHYDHFGGLFDVLNTLTNRQKASKYTEPEIYKKLDGNQFENEVFQRYPTLTGKVRDLKHNDTFKLDDEFDLKALYTPGHATDHFSILMSPINKEDNKENLLFSGDIILGTPSTSVQELSSYMETLYSLRNEDFSHICLPHSLDSLPESIIVDGKVKLEQYIQYREERDRNIMACFKDDDKITKDDLYNVIYGSRGLIGGLQLAAINNLELHLAKLVKDKQLMKVEGKDEYYRNNHKI